MYTHPIYPFLRVSDSEAFENQFLNNDIFLGNSSGRSCLLSILFFLGKASVTLQHFQRKAAEVAASRGTTKTEMGNVSTKNLSGFSKVFSHFVMSFRNM